MKKRISALVIAMSVFMCSSTFAFAAESDIVSEHKHTFSIHRHVGSEYREGAQPHTYLYGYDSKGNEIYRNDCLLYSVYIACDFECSDKSCTTIMPGGRHRDFIRFDHSIVHP